MQKTKTSSKSSPKSKGLLIGGLVTLGLALAGGAVWFFTRKKDSKGESDLLIADTTGKNILPAPPKNTGVSNSKPNWKPVTFPLRRGMRGTMITQLQRALIKRHGNVLPRYGADGDFGGETEAALRKNGYSVPVDQPTFNLLTGGNQGGSGQSTTGANGQSVSVVGAVDGQVLAQAINGKDIATIGLILSRMKSTADYSTVSNALKRITTYNRFGQGAKRNLVNALMGDNMPWNHPTRTTFATHLKRMGLKHNSSADRWTLSGLGCLGQVNGMNAMTLGPTVIWNDMRQVQNLPGGVVLGPVSRSSNGVVKVITNQGEIVYVSVSDVIIA